MTDSPLSGDRIGRDTLVLIGALAGVGAVLSGAAPVGTRWIDAIEILLGVVLLVVAGCRAPWWLQTAVAGLAAAVALDVAPLLLGIAAFAVAAWASPIPDALPARAIGGAISLGLTANSLIRSDLQIVGGASAVVGIGACLAVIIGGAVTGGPELRRLVARSLLVGLGVVVIGVLAIGVAGLGARDAARDAKREVRIGLTEARAFEFGDAALTFGQAAEQLDEVSNRVGAWWTSPARFVPIVAQHRALAVGATREVATLLDAAATDLDTLPLDRLRLVRGAIDLDAVAQTEEPLDRIGRQLVRIDAELAGRRSFWLHPAVTDVLDETADDVDRFRTSVDRAERAVQLAPGLLGGETPRRYLMLFVTPSEARGVGGFIGNYAVLGVDDGQLSIVESGRRTELERRADAAGVRLVRPVEMLERYGKFGLVTSDGTVSARSWSNLTIEPDFPSFARAATDLYNASHPDPVDGVLSMDPFVLQQLLAYTGPIERPGGGADLDQRNLARFLLVDQYLADEGQTERIDQLESISTAVIGKFLTGEFPSPARLARDLSPYVGEQRLTLWTDDADEFDLLAAVGLSAGLPDVEGSDGFSLAMSNAGGSKIDAFLRRTVDIERRVVDDVSTMVATVELTNTGPADGFPDYVIGNAVGLPPGTSRLYLVAYTSSTVVSVTVDGVEELIERGDELGWSTSAHSVDIAPGSSVIIEYEFAALTADQYVTRVQPLATRGDG